MEGNKAAVLIDADMEIRDVAVAHKDLRVLPYRFIIEVLHDPAAAVSAADAENGIYFRVCEHPVDPVRPKLCGARRKAMPVCA